MAVAGGISDGGGGGDVNACINDKITLVHELVYNHKQCG